MKNKEEHLYHGDFFDDCDGVRKRFQYVRGLILVWRPHYGTFMIHYPTTKQSVSLSNTEYKHRFYLFGYDPLGNEYKVVGLREVAKHETFCQVFTLGDPKNLWTTIQCGIGLHFLFGHPVCINGAIYYKAKTKNESFVLVSLDVRSLEFNHVQAPEKELLDRQDTPLVNYQGKLGCLSRNRLNKKDVDLWVMENAEKQEWSSKVTFVAMLQDLPKRIRFAGVTHPGGEVVLFLVSDPTDLASVVYYYDPKRNSRRRVEIQTTLTSSERTRLRRFVRMWAVTDHVENIMRL